jgi:hypothetical protein
VTISSRRHPIFSGAEAPVSPGAVLSTWAALVALWALPYLTLLDYLRIDMAQSEALQWLLAAIGASGVASVLFTAWRQSRDPAWRASHGFPIRGR